MLVIITGDSTNLVLAEAKRRKADSVYYQFPESGLDPKELLTRTKYIADLSKRYIVIVATFSLFLMRELDILQTKEDVDFLWVNVTHEGLFQSKDIDDIRAIAVLDAELEQSHRYMEVINAIQDSNN